jgi:hypothetical protein
LGVERLLQRGCCREAAAERLLQRGCCREAAAERLLQRGRCRMVGVVTPKKKGDIDIISNGSDNPPARGTEP